MKKNWLLILIFLLLIALGIIVSIIITKRREARINRFEFPTTMVANNYTSHKYADTISLIILNKIYHYDTINLNIYYVPKYLSSDKYDIIGFIQKNPYQPHSYNIFVKNGILPISIKRFLSHELIHLHQMEIGDLVQIDYTKIVYKGDTIYFSQVPYEKRLYEIEAFSHESSIQKALNKLLYSK
jgi:hypothetical protein